MFLHVPMELDCVIMFRIAHSGLGIEFDFKSSMNCFNFDITEWIFFHVP
jgi:hypothetical protein